MSSRATRGSGRGRHRRRPAGARGRARSPHARRMRTSVLTRGLSAPRSQREITDWAVPIASARAVWVSPAAARACAMRRPRSVRARGFRSGGVRSRRSCGTGATNVIAEAYYSGTAIARQPVPSSPMTAAADGADLTGRVVIVTGASRGIGKGLAIGLAGARRHGRLRGAAPSTRHPDGLPGTIHETVAAIERPAAPRSRCAATSATTTTSTHLVDATIAELRARRRAGEQRDGADACRVRRARPLEQWDESMRGQRPQPVRLCKARGART